MDRKDYVVLFFDIGANRGEATEKALKIGYDKVIALECAPRMYPLLAKNFFNDTRVVPLKFAVTDKMDQQIEFYECGNGEINQGDGSSTTELSWLTDPKSRVAGMSYRTVRAQTCTIDWLIEQYGVPDLVKIDVEGGEHKIIQTLSYKPKQIAFEWHLEFLDDYIKDVEKLDKYNGYKEFALQYITHHLEEPTEYRPIEEIQNIYDWIEKTKSAWENNGWLDAGGYNPKADVGMIWVR